MSETRAIILAAGRGSRMGGLTEDQPKCLTRVGGRTLLDWQMEALHGAGIGQVAAVRGYRADRLTRPDLVPFDNPRWAETNMVASLTCAGAWLAASDCVVSYSDIIYPAAAVTALLAATGDVLITYDVDWLDLWSLRFEDPLDDAETFRIDETGRVLEIGGKTRVLGDIQGQYMGLLRFSPAGWHAVGQVLATLPADRQAKLDMTSLLNLLIRQGVAVRGVPLHGGWFEIDTEQDRTLCERLIAQRGGRLWTS